MRLPAYESVKVDNTQQRRPAVNGAPPVAKPGDICVLVEPTPADAARLRQLQSTLQANFGGHVHHRPHFTSQRFHLEHERRLPQLIDGLRQQLPVLKPIPVVASALMLVEHPFWECHVLRWELDINPQLRRFARQLDLSLVINGATLHYPQNGAWCPHVTALEEIRDSDFPCPGVSDADDYLFTAHRVVLSQVREHKQFEILEIIELEDR